MPRVPNTTPHVEALRIIREIISEWDSTYVPGTVRNRYVETFQMKIAGRWRDVPVINRVNGSLRAKDFDK